MTEPKRIINQLKKIKEWFVGNIRFWLPTGIMIFGAFIFREHIVGFIGGSSFLVMAIAEYLLCKVGD